MEIVSLSAGKYNNLKGRRLKKMRKIVFLLFFAAFLCSSFDGFAQKRRRAPVISSENIRVSMVFPGSPRIHYAKKGSSDAKDSYPWLQIRVLYSFGKRKFRQGFTFDNMRCDVYLRTRARKNSWKRNIWFTGTQKLFSVIPDNFGSKHQIWMSLPPPLLYKETDGTKSYDQLVKDSIVYVYFYAGERLLGRKVWLGASNGKVDSRQEGVLLNAFRRMNDNPQYKIVNGLWPLEKTPWQWLVADRMDLPQVEFEKSSSGKSVKKSEDQDEEFEEDSEADDAKKDSRQAQTVKKEEDDDSFENIDFTRSTGKAKRNKRGKR